VYGGMHLQTVDVLFDLLPQSCVISQKVQWALNRYCEMMLY